MIQPNIMEGGHQLHHPLYMTAQNTTSESDLNIRLGRYDNVFDSENQKGGSSSDDQDQQVPKKRFNRRHTRHQIQKMEAFFKECPLPNDKQKKELSRELGLTPLQVKFWFQNKRNQIKTQHERHENIQLRTENEKLSADNVRYREALSRHSLCPNCGGPTPTIGEMSFYEHNLRVENARLREEIDLNSAIAAENMGNPVVNPLLSSTVPPRPVQLGPPAGMGGEMYGGATGDLLSEPNEADKNIIIELAIAAMEELIMMAQMGEPLWMTSLDGASVVLNEEEYIRTFPRETGPKAAGFKCEASREASVVIMNTINLVEILMDVSQWSTIFSGVVSRAMTLEVLSTGVSGNFNGAMQVMTAEIQVPSPLVPTRESYFVRYCKQHADGTWAVVDVSLDNLRPSPAVRCRRRPSGCLFQEMPNGHSKVTWVEHVEVDYRDVHNLYKQLVNSGHAFGAKRWVATLDRQCERLASATATNIQTGDIGVTTNQDGRKSMLKLSERMVISFYAGVSASTTHTWTTISGTETDNIRIMTRKSMDDPGTPPGIVLNVATSFWLPIPPKRVFDFLREENSRSEWDILSNGGVVQEMTHIANGRDTGNCLSLLRINSDNSFQSKTLILQESCTDQTASFVIYAPVDTVAMNVVLNGGDPDKVALLPSGFAILHNSDRGIPGGSLLTVAFQILVDSVPTAKLSLGSVATVNNLIAWTVERIKASLSCDNA
ncbi:Octamer-binding transcription factor [Parasponia andersonii]|uniref:Octamer-binding transcription factor n=1 Tax=Parasponia andersonii TaxID=3476 RepID=A0A2P5CTF9_PARAD|nr:Octamer-binding transcription factor [Parasponia andersonii]